MSKKRTVLYDRVINVVLSSVQTAKDSLTVINTTGKGTPSAVLIMPGHPQQTKAFKLGKLYIYSGKQVLNLKKGLRPNGTDMLVPGDRIRYMTGKESLYYYVEDASRIKQDSQSMRQISITCPSNGMKPHITLNISLIPGQLCYQTTVKIRNLNIDRTDIRQWNHMTITAGYANGSIATYDSPIFSSYVESPNPDGVTTFVGLTVGTVSNPLSLQSIKLTFPTNAFSVRNLITAVGKYVCRQDASVINQLSDDINDVRISSSSLTAVCSNGYQLLVWLQRILNESTLKIKNAHGESPRILVQLVNGALIIFSTNYPNKPVKDVPELEIIDLNAVTSAMFNGTLCTVEAPWNPSLQPGMLFYMPPHFIQGSKLPNVVDATLYKSPRNLYRVIKEDVAFSTCGAENKMRIEALPEQYIKKMQVGESYYTPQQLEEYLKGKVRNEGNIVVEGASDEEMETEQETDPIKRMFEAPTISTAAVSWTTLKVDAPVTGDSYSLIAQRFYHEQGLEELQVDPKDPTLTVRPSSTWPLILVGTYQAHQKSNGTKYYAVEIDNPDYIQDGVELYVPVFTDFKALAPMSSVFYWAYKTYQSIYVTKARRWLQEWKGLYKYLTGKDIDE